MGIRKVRRHFLFVVCVVSVLCDNVRTALVSDNQVWSTSLRYYDDLLTFDEVLSFPRDDDEWEYVVNFCWDKFYEKPLYVRRCTVEVWKHIESFVSAEMGKLSFEESERLDSAYELWTSWSRTITKQRELIHSQKESCALSKQFSSVDATKNISIMSAHFAHHTAVEECGYASRFLAYSLRQNVLARRALILSLPGVPQRIDLMRRWRQSADTSVSFAFVHDPNAELARASIGSKWVPFDMYVHNAEHCAYISKEILQCGFWEAVKTSRVLNLMERARRDPSRDPVFVDVGANIGWYTLAAAAQGYRTVAIEPAKYNTELLRASLSLNGLDAYVELYPVAVSDEPKDVGCLRIAPYGRPSSNRGNFQMTSDSCLDSDAVPVTTLDHMFSFDADDADHSNADVQVMKLDIEGFEAKALRGARAMLRSARPPCYVILEYIPVYLEMSGVDRPTAVFEELMEIGYELFADSPHGLGERISDLSALVGDRDYELRWPSPRCRGFAT